MVINVPWLNIEIKTKAERTEKRFPQKSHECAPLYWVSLNWFVEYKFIGWFKLQIYLIGASPLAVAKFI